MTDTDYRSDYRCITNHKCAMYDKPLYTLTNSCLNTVSYVYIPSANKTSKLKLAVHKQSKIGRKSS